MREKQEKQLHDYIRVNLRKVMGEQKANEAKEAEREKAMEVHAREARLESLRKFARRKLLQPQEINGKPTTVPTQAFILLYTHTF